MARPGGKGLKYFPFDVGLFGDKKLKLLKGQHGAEGIEVYIRLLCKCYSDDNGYFLPWSPDEDFALLAEETGYSEDKIRLIVSSCILRSLFEDKLFLVGNVLSSRGIQRRYFGAIKLTKLKAAAEGRYTLIPKDLCLLTDEDFSELNKSRVWLKVTNDLYFSGNNSLNSGKNPSKSKNNPADQIRSDQIRSDKIRSDQIITCDSASATATFTPPTIDAVKKYCLERNNKIDAAQFIDYYTTKGWYVGKSIMKDWKAAIRTWERNKKNGNSDTTTKNPFLQMLQEDHGYEP